MGRRDVSVTDDRRWAFNRLADHYGWRPPYPEPLLARIVELAHAGPVLDVGAGTGHLALPLARRGLKVTASEPARKMLEALTARALEAGLPIQAVHAAAEATGLPDESHSAAVIADAVHWLDPELAAKELRRVLVPGGALLVLEVKPGENAFTRGLEALLATHNPRRRRVETEGAVTQLFAMVCARAPETEVFSDAHRLEALQLEGLLRTFSHLGAGGEEAFAQLVSAARILAEGEGGAVWERSLTLRWGHRVDTGG